MSPKEGNALLMILGDKKKDKDAPMSEEDGDESDYDGDLKTALTDLAAALGVSVKDAGRGVEALKTVHDVCSRAGK